MTPDMWIRELSCPPMATVKAGSEVISLTHEHVVFSFLDILLVLTGHLKKSSPFVQHSLSVQCEFCGPLPSFCVKYSGLTSQPTGDSVFKPLCLGLNMTLSLNSNWAVTNGVTHFPPILFPLLKINQIY